MGIAGWQYFTTQKQWEAYLKDLMRTNDTALKRAIVLIYNRQTEPERQSGESTEENGVGFTKWDAKELGDIAKKIQQDKELTKGELAKSRNKMCKYWKQLMVVSKEQQEKRKAEEQKAIEDKLDEEVKLAMMEDAQALERFKEHNEILRECAEDGVQCEYGICDECPVTRGFQMRMDFK